MSAPLEAVLAALRCEDVEIEFDGVRYLISRPTVADAIAFAAASQGEDWRMCSAWLVMRHVRIAEHPEAIANTPAHALPWPLVERLAPHVQQLYEEFGPGK